MNKEQERKRLTAARIISVLLGAMGGILIGGSLNITVSWSLVGLMLLIGGLAFGWSRVNLGRKARAVRPPSRESSQDLIDRSKWQVLSAESPEILVEERVSLEDFEEPIRDTVRRLSEDYGAISSVKVVPGFLQLIFIWTPAKRPEARCRITCNLFERLQTEECALRLLTDSYQEEKVRA